MGRRGKGLAIRLLSYAKAKKMKSLTLHTNGNPSARLRECSPSTKYLPYFAIHRALLFCITFDHTLNTTRDIVQKKCRGGELNLGRVSIDLGHIFTHSRVLN